MSAAAMSMPSRTCAPNAVERSGARSTSSCKRAVSMRVRAMGSNAASSKHTSRKREDMPVWSTDRVLPLSSERLDLKEGQRLM